VSTFYKLSDVAISNKSSYKNKASLAAMYAGTILNNDTWQY